MAQGRFPDEEKTIVMGRDEDPTQAYLEEIQPHAVDAGAMRNAVAARVVGYRRAQAELREAVVAVVERLDAPQVRAILVRVVAEFPELALAEPILAAANRHHVEVPWDKGETALRGLRALAANHAPTTSLGTAKSIAKFVCKLDGVLAAGAAARMGSS
jgi:hypothetical protein